MNGAQRSQRAILVTLAAIVLAGGGVAAGAAATADNEPAARPAAAVSVPRAAPDGYADVVRAVLPSVVAIRTPDGLGSGVVLDRAGNIVTNAHVAGDATSFQVQLASDPAPRPARLVGSYPADDLAVIRAADPAGLIPARFGDSAKAQAGDVVLAVGNPLGLSGSVTEGIVSATGRAVTEPGAAGSPAATLPDAIQTSAPINPGNSGGALVNTAGQVIGIPTLAAASPGSGAQAQGIGFAIPANLVRDIARQLIESGHVTSSGRAMIGARVATVAGPGGSPAGTGIVSVTPGGPAARAGLQAGDVITSAGRTPTPDTAALAQVLAAAEPGQPVTLTVTRDGQPRTVRVTLGELPGS